MNPHKQTVVNLHFCRGILFILGLVLFSAPTRATPLKLQLQPVLAPSQTLSPAPTQPSPSPLPSTLSWDDRLSFYGAGLGVALASVPLSLKAGAYLGTVSNELYATLLLPFGAFVILPAVAVTLAQHVFSHKRNIKTRFWLWPLLGGLGVQMAGFAAGAMLGVNPHNLNELVAFSLVQALLLPTLTTVTFGPQTRPLTPTRPVDLGASPAPTHSKRYLTKSAFVHVPLWTSRF